MSWFKRNPLFFSVLILLGIVLVAQLVVFMQKRSEAERMRLTYESKIDEYDWLRYHSPSMTRENVDLARQDLAQVRDNLERIRGALGAEADVSEIFANPPANPTDAYFDIIAFVQEYRQKARQVDVNDGAGVRLPSEEYMFGFSRYAETGPPGALVESVYKQRQIVAYLLDTLYAVRPVELIRISRGDVAERAGVSAPSGPGDDVFRIAPEVSARIPDFVETYEFQVVFVGYTRNLRDFINRIASEQSEIPLLVRSVEVQPVEGAQTGQQTGAQTGANDAVPIVAANFSRFTVTVEFIELVSPSE